MLGPDRKWGIWPIEGGEFRPIPGLESPYNTVGWSSDGDSVYAVSSRANQGTADVYKVNVASGKMELWKTFGQEAAAGTRGVGSLRFSSDGTAYAYVYSVTLSQAYVVTGLK